MTWVVWATKFFLFSFTCGLIRSLKNNLGGMSGKININCTGSPNAMTKVNDNGYVKDMSR